MLASWRVIAGFGALCFFLASMSGCGGRSDLGIVNGRVTLDGKPLENAFVEFVPQATGSLAMGRTDSSGNYSLMYTRDVKGAALGENVVRITTQDILDEGGREVRVPERVPAKYNTNSELIVTVNQGKNQLNFELESAGRITEQEYLPGL